MIRPVQKNNLQVHRLENNFKGNEENDVPYNGTESMDPELLEARCGYALACLYAAEAKLENAELKRRLAAAEALVNYNEAC